MPIDLVVAGAAAKTSVVGSMTIASPGAGGTFDLTSASGYPATGKFMVHVSRGAADEEKILVNSRSGVTCTVGQRGYDGTSAADHAAGATAELGLPALVVQTLIDHENGTQVNPHSGVLLNNAAHDIEARHTFGAALGTPVTPTVLTPDIAGAAGTGNNPAREDHAHNVPADVAITITGTNAEGAAASFARSNHNHQIGGTNHIPAAAMVNKSIAAGQITDGTIANGTLVASGQALHYVGGTDPGAVGAGAVWHNTATNKRATLRRNAGNTAWEVLEAYDWVSYVPTYPGMAAVGNAVHFARYIRKGGVVIINGFFRIGSTTSFSGLLNLAIGLPTNAAAKDLDSFVNYPTVSTAEFFGHGAARATDDSAAQVFAAVGIVPQAGASKATDRLNFFATAGSAAWGQNVPFPWATNDRFSYFAEYEPATLEDSNWV